MGKTPTYIKHAVKRYREKMFFISVTIPIEYKDRLKAVGINATVARALILKELEKREAEKP